MTSRPPVPKNRHNGIFDSINTLQAKHRLDPIDKLPPELFTHIIQILHNIAFETIRLNLLQYHKILEANDTILSLALVSQRWMQFIVNTPMFWTNIVLDEMKEDYFSNVSTFLPLSQELSITVYIRDSLTLEQSATWLELLERRN